MTVPVNATPARVRKSNSPWGKGPHCATPAAAKSYLRYVRNGKPEGKA